MVIRKADRCTQECENMCGGKGSVILNHIVDASELRDNGRLYAHVIIHPGDSLGCHSHTGECEIYYFLKGEAVCRDNGKGVVMRPGDVMITRDGGSHEVYNESRSDVEFIALITNEAK